MEDCMKFCGNSLPSVFAAMLAAVFLSGADVSAAEDATSAAKGIIQTTGVRIGLCLHLGCGRQDSSALTAALAENSDLLVHGLAFDKAALERARQAIVNRKVGGRAMVECVEWKPLPYLRDLANLIVVEDLGELTAKGISQEELLRVLAPGGTLCVRENGQWTRTLKPRPDTMDEWNHPQHGADGNLVSQDKNIGFPLGLRWIDGVPICVFPSPSTKSGRYGPTRALISASGRVFTLNVNVLENLGAKRDAQLYLSARDAWNGLPLWKIPLGTTDDGSALNYRNTGPLATDGQRVYAACTDRVIGVDAATGKILTESPTRNLPMRLLLLDGILVVSSWKASETSRAEYIGFDGQSWASALWGARYPKTSDGSVEAFDARSGKALWSAPYPAFMLLGANGMVYALTHNGNPPTERAVVAIDLKTGAEKWRMPHTQLGGDADLQLNLAGPGYVIVASRTLTKAAIFVLSAEDGHMLWKVQPADSQWTHILDGLVWHDNKKYEPLSGAPKGEHPFKIDKVSSSVQNHECTPPVIIGGRYLSRSRNCAYVEQGGRTFLYTGARGGCLQGMVPANGIFYAAQNYCACCPGQVYGFLGIGPSGEWPKKEDFEKPRPVEKGPAFGKVEQFAIADGDWPMFMHDAGRSSASNSSTPDGLNRVWQVKLVESRNGPVVNAWKARLGSCLSAPVVAAGRIYAAETDLGQIVALDAASGQKIWSTTLGGRIDSPPTLHKGLCLVGCHDGWVYALRANDGQLVWRTRVAPWERRMVAHGAVESVWPAIGTILVHGDLAYASAGRTSESDGGVAVVAFNPASGETAWAKAIAQGGLRQNDMLAMRDAALGWHHLRFSPTDGASHPPIAIKLDTKSLPGGDRVAIPGGMLDDSWTRMGGRRSGNAFQMGKLIASVMAWNETTAITPDFSVARAKIQITRAPQPLDVSAVLKAGEYTWKLDLPKDHQVEAIALASKSIIYAGSINDAPSNKVTGFLWLVALADGKKMAEVPLESAPSYEGLAVAGGRVYVSLQNGNLLCFGK